MSHLLSLIITADAALAHGPTLYRVVFLAQIVPIALFACWGSVMPLLYIQREP